MESKIIKAFEEKGAMRPGDIATATGIAKDDVSKVIKKMVADGIRDKVYSRKDAGGILESLISKYVSKDQDLDFGALQGNPFSTVVRDFWEKLNTVDKEKRRGMAERFADYVLKCSTMKEVFENSENAKLLRRSVFLIHI